MGGKVIWRKFQSHSQNDSGDLRGVAGGDGELGCLCGKAHTSHVMRIICRGWKGVEEGHEVLLGGQLLLPSTSPPTHTEYNILWFAISLAPMDSIARLVLFLVPPIHCVLSH